MPFYYFSVLERNISRERRGLFPLVTSSNSLEHRVPNNYFLPPSPLTLILFQPSSSIINFVISNKLFQNFDSIFTKIFITKSFELKKRRTFLKLRKLSVRSMCVYV